MRQTTWGKASAAALGLAILFAGGGWEAAQGQTPAPAASSVMARQRHLHQAVATDQSGGSAAPVGNFQPVATLTDPTFQYGSPSDAACATCGGHDASRAHCGRGWSLGRWFRNPCHNGGWARVEYLLWWTKSQTAPPLVTTSPNSGVLPDATILYGGQGINDGVRSGGRLELGTWLDHQHDWGLMGRYLQLGEGNTNFTRPSNGSTVLSRPFISATTGNEAAFRVAAPGFASGTVSVDTSNDLLLAEALARRSLVRRPYVRLDLLGGYFFSRVDDSLRVATTQSGLGGLPVGTQINIRDDFSTQNEFHGGQIGLLMERKRGLWSFRVLGKVALGNMNQRVRIRGFRSNTPAGAPQGGLLAQPTNIGDYQRNRFAVVPEVDLTLGYQVSEHLTATLGYSFIYWSSVVRPGDVIDRTVNLQQAPLVGPARPAFTFADSDYFAQGVNFGLKYQY